MKKSLSIATAAAVAGYRAQRQSSGGSSSVCPTTDTSSIVDVFGDGSCVSTFPLDGNTHNLKRIVDSKYFKTIYGNSPAASDWFGGSCAIGSDFFLVGSFMDDDKATDAGKVDMFSLDGTYIKTIYSSSPGVSDRFGVSCAIGSNFFLVGSHSDDDKASNAGKVEMFSLNGSYIKTIYSNSPAVSDYFGASCAIGSDFFLVGSTGDDDKGSNTGKVEMFSLDGTYIKTIYGNSPVDNDYFGVSCAIGSDFFLVGSHTDDDKGSAAGKVEMFSLDGTYIKTIYSNSPAVTDNFGTSCAIGSDFFLVGSDSDDDKGDVAGKVEMFSLDGTYIKTIYSNSPSVGDLFGKSCAIGSDFFLVGSYNDDDKATDAGKVEMFAIVKEDMKDKYKDVVYEKTIYGNSPAASDQFGSSCAIGSDFFLVGSQTDDDKGDAAGKVEMFSLDGTYIKTIYSNSPAATDYFGVSCAIGSNFFLVGSHGDDDKGTDAGKVEMFSLDGTYIKTIYSNSPGVGDFFGRSCAIGSDFFLVGSFNDDDKTSNAGKVEMFSLDGTYIKTIYSNNPAASDFFGVSCAIGSNFFLVGSHFDDDKGTNAGKVEMFSLNGTYIKNIYSDYSNSPAASDYFGISCAIGSDFFLVGSYGDDDKATDAGKVEMFSLDGTYIKTIYGSSPAAGDGFGSSCAIGSSFFLVGSYSDDDKAGDAGKVEMFRLGDITTPLNVSYEDGKFGQCAVFNGTSSKITTTIPLSLTQTFSFWIKTSVNGSEDIWTGAQGITGFDIPGVGGGDFSIKLNSTNKMMLFIGFVPGVDNFIQGTKTVTDNVWHHVVVTIDKANSKINLYVDGILDGTFSGTLSVLNAYNIEFGRNTFSYFNGSIDQVRIFNKALTLAEVSILYNEKKVQDSTVCDPYWSKTSLLLSGDGTNGSQNFTDLTGKNTITAVGNAQISTSNKKFGTGSMSFTSYGDYITIPSSSNFAFGTDDFTIEMWYKPVSNKPSNYGRILQFGPTWSDASTFVLLDRHNDYPTKYSIGLVSSNGVLVSNKSVVPDTWVHIALVKSNSNTISLYLDGVLDSTATYSGNFGNSTSNTLKLMSAGDSESYNFGNIDDLRITKGVARYTSNFTVPDKALPSTGI